jgi:hypothetical protein
MREKKQKLLIQPNSQPICGSARYISHRIYDFLQRAFIQNVEALVGGDLHMD